MRGGLILLGIMLVLSGLGSRPALANTSARMRAMAEQLQQAAVLEDEIVRHRIDE